MVKKANKLMTRENYNRGNIPTLHEMERRLQHLDHPSAIQSEIENTRQHMSRTLNVIQDKLSPERLKREAKDALRDATIGKVEDMTHTAKQEVKSWRKNLTQSIKDNPIPAAMIGAGLAWMFFSGSDDENDYPTFYDQNFYGREPQTRYGTPYTQGSETRSAIGDKANEVQRKVNKTVENAQETLSETANNIQETVSERAEQIRERKDEFVHSAQEQLSEVQSNLQARAAETQEEAERRMAQLQYEARVRSRQMQRQAKQTWQQNPIAVGLAAAAAGALFGLLIPNTELENRLVGETRDQVVSEAQQAAVNTYEKAQQVAAQAVETVKEDAPDLKRHVEAVAKDVQKTAVKEAEKQELVGSASKTSANKKS